MEGTLSVFEATYRKLMPGALQEFLTREDLDRFLQKRYQFLEKKKDEIEVRIDNPEDLAWLINSSTIEVCMPDSPFITDTILDYLTSEGHRIHLSIPALLSVEREGGHLKSLEPVTGLETTEAFVYVEIQKLSEKESKVVQRDLIRNLKELRQVVQDFPAALKQLRSLHLPHPSLEEDRQWIAENFVTLGAGFLKEGKLQKTTGLLRENGLRQQALADMGKMFQSRKLDLREPQLQNVDFMLFHESNIMSRVNRHRALHLIVIPSATPFLLAGHFAGRGELTPRFLNPPARKKVEKLAERVYAPPNSHRRKLLFQIAQLIPVGIFLSRPQELIERWLMQILDNLYVEEPDFTVDLDPEYGMVWILGIVSGKEASAFSPEHVQRVALRYEFETEILIRRRMNEHEILILAVCPENGSEPRYLEDLHHRLHSSVSSVFASWQNRFRKSLTNHFIGERLIEEKLAMYREALSPAAEVHQEPEEALQDLIRLEELHPGNELKVSFFRKKEDVFIKIYSLQARPIGDLVPVLANFGFRVTDEFTFPGNFPEHTRFVYAYRIQDSDLDSRYDSTMAGVLEAVILRNASDEPVNRLAVYGLDRNQLALIKSLQAYLFQIDRTFSRAFIARASLTQKEFIQSLVRWLECRFHPTERHTDREADILKGIYEIQDSISSVMESLLCRKLLSIAHAIVRTNYFSFLPEISFKIHSPDIQGLASPVPLYEIFVYSADLEAVHLRGASIARGGIRWSDRPDDFRTEIHGLMKAQMVKNTIIVPSGSKGGFCLKGHRSTDPSFALECYRRFMACLLALTDNRSPAGKVKRPPLVCLDAPDPYLVVAADKGTARFSDDANEVSQQAGFWLGDAFASGGKHGYDHKRQGITARGAWESVKRHFHEMGQDPQKDPISVVGIGDMAGDVFGNGMLLSRSMKLVAAFNHKHIFLDPEPPAQAWKERKRLFDNVLGWDQYTEALISEGGGVFDRSSARIRISPQMQEVLNIGSEMSGEELIRSILGAPVDLLWNGGIGTYVKSSSEGHDDAMDPANDRVRINGNQVRARVIGEGGNLGFTQKGRIEAALNGSRLNTDAVDNSGGVDMSDHEVNLKILLERLMRTGELKGLEQRNQWIEKLQERMIELVLQNNRANNISLSLDQRRVQSRPESFLATVRWLESCGHYLEGLSSEELHLSDQPSRHFVRPVLCSMLGHARLELKKELLKSPELNIAQLQNHLTEYFPDALVEAFEEEVHQHPLRKEIVVTEILNHATNFGGITFFWSLVQKTGASVGSILLARMAVEQFIGADEMRDRDHDHAGSEMDHLLFLEDQIESMTAMLLMKQKPDKLELSRDGRKRFASILEYLEVYCNESTTKAKSGAECMDRAFWLFLHLEDSGPATQDTLQRYVTIMQSDAMQTADRYLALPISPNRAEMRFYRRIRQKRDEAMRQLLAGTIHEDNLSRLRTLADGEEMKAVAIYEGLEAILTDGDSPL
ncbi:MAG: NAD-glutamate dehydrogenase [Leptospiraceae bacterium]|nr:NAD-glutamate dehydrogenase [Leptospiraceae bacterium]